MSSYLHLQHGTEHKSYALTDQCNKPYVNIGPNKLPLMTGSGSGTNTMNLHIVAGGG